MLRRALSLISAGATAAARDDEAAAADLIRAHQRRPAAASAVAGGTGAAAFAAISRAVAASGVAARPCEEWDHAALNAAATVLLDNREPRLGEIYRQRNDKRADAWAPGEREARWRAEARGAAPGTAAYNVTRDGKCAEAVMLWAHHVAAPARARLAAEAGFALPLMPARGPVQPELRDEVYHRQITCADCHVDPRTHKNASTVTTPPLRTGNTTKCTEIDPDTGKVTVFYNRTKRVDWDYDPPCQPCESIGGYMWGDLEDEIQYTTCSVVMKASEIPADNMTHPRFPPHMSVEQWNVEFNQANEAGPFPGGDPCATHKFELQNQTFWYDGDALKMHFKQYSVYGGAPPPYTGAPPPGVAPGESVNVTSYMYPNGNMYVRTATTPCLCITPYQSGDHSQPPIGPLMPNCFDDAVLVGRERIGVEDPDDLWHRPKTEVVADHWNKGPHHVWVEVATDLIVRQWQPFNGLNIFFNYNLTAPNPAIFDIDPLCLAPAPTVNISCIAAHWNTTTSA